MDHTNNNPSDKSGATSRQDTVIGVVVDNKDPNETGRIRVRIVGEQDDNSVSDNDLPWYPVMTNGYPQVGGVGRFPAGGMYLPGSRIVMRNVGQQGFIIEGAIQSSETQQGKEGRHPESTSTSTVEVRGGEGRTHQTVLDGNKMINELDRTTSEAMRVLNGEASLVWKRETQKIKKIIEEAKTSPQFNERSSARTKEGDSPMPISANPWDYAQNAQKFVQSIPNGELIKGATSMLDNLKKTAQNSSNPQQIMSLGGLNNIMGALQSVMSFIKKHKPKKKNEPESEEERLLREKLEKLANDLIDPSIPTS